MGWRVKATERSHCYLSTLCLVGVTYARTTGWARRLIHLRITEGRLLRKRKLSFRYRTLSSEREHRIRALDGPCPFLKNTLTLAVRNPTDVCYWRQPRRELLMCKVSHTEDGGEFVLKRAERWQHHVANSAVDRQSVMKSRLG